MLSGRYGSNTKAPATTLPNAQPLKLSRSLDQTAVGRPLRLPLIARLASEALALQSRTSSKDGSFSPHLARGVFGDLRITNAEVRWQRFHTVSRLNLGTSQSRSRPRAGMIRQTTAHGGEGTVRSDYDRQTVRGVFDPAGICSPGLRGARKSARGTLIFPTPMQTPYPTSPLSQNKHLLRWVEKMAELCQAGRDPLGGWLPGGIRRALRQMVAAGTFIRLNQDNCGRAASWRAPTPSDVARVEDRTFICSLSKDSAGPTNNWVNPFEMRHKLQGAFRRRHARAHDVRPCLQHGPGRLPDVADRRPADRLALCRRQHADHGADRQAGLRARSTRPTSASCPCLHSVGAPLPAGQPGRALALQRGEVHRPLPRDARDLELRLGLRRQRAAGQEVFRPADRLGHGARRGLDGGAHADPRASKTRRARKTYVAAAFPSACGKTNFAMLIPPPHFQEQGWKVWTVGDDIAWIKPDAHGRLRAINPEAGFFGVAPGTSVKHQPQRDGGAGPEHDLHQRGADARGRRLVGGHDRQAPAGAPRLAGQGMDAGTRAARPGPRPRIPNARFTAPAAQCPTIDPDRDNPGRACRSARSSSAVAGRPRCRWSTRRSTGSSGVYVGATMGSEMTAAAGGAVGKVRRDPMAMLPFCGYHMGDYFRHWINMQRQALARRRASSTSTGSARTPTASSSGPASARTCACSSGSSTARKDGRRARETPIGWMPRYEDLEWTGLDFSEREIRGAAGLRPAGLARGRSSATRSFSSTCTTASPKEMVYERELLICRLG